MQFLTFENKTKQLCKFMLGKYLVLNSSHCITRVSQNHCIHYSKKHQAVKNRVLHLYLCFIENSWNTSMQSIHVVSQHFYFFFPKLKLKHYPWEKLLLKILRTIRQSRELCSLSTPGDFLDPNGYNYGLSGLTSKPRACEWILSPWSYMGST